MKWTPHLHEYVQYRDASGSEWMDARVSQITTHTITVFVFKYRIAHQINKFKMKDYIKKHPKDAVLNTFKKEPWTGIVGTYGQPETLGDMDSTRLEVRNTPQQSAITQEGWNRIERAEQKDAQDKADINDLNDAIWRAVWVAVGLGLAGLFYLAYHFRFQLDLLNLGAKL